MRPLITIPFCSFFLSLIALGQGESYRFEDFQLKARFDVVLPNHLNCETQLQGLRDLQGCIIGMDSVLGKVQQMTKEMEVFLAMEPDLKSEQDFFWVFQLFPSEESESREILYSVHPIDGTMQVMSGSFELR